MRSLDMREEAYTYLHTKSWRDMGKAPNLYDIFWIVMQMRRIIIDILCLSVILLCRVLTKSEDQVALPHATNERRWLPGYNNSDQNHVVCPPVRERRSLLIRLIAITLI